MKPKHLHPLGGRLQFLSKTPIFFPFMVYDNMTSLPGHYWADSEDEKGLRHQRAENNV